MKIIFYRLLDTERKQPRVLISFVLIGRNYDGYKKLFHGYDHDDDGFLEVEDLQEYFKIQGKHLSDKKAKDEIKMMGDTDGDGKISFEDYIQARPLKLG